MTMTAADATTMTEAEFEFHCDARNAGARGRSAADVLAFAHANGIVGRIVKTNRRTQDRVYVIAGRSHEVRATIDAHEGRRAA